MQLIHPRSTVTRLKLTAGCTFVVRSDRAAMANYDCTPEERAELGMADNLVRLAVSREDADDVIADLDQALKSIG